MKTEFTYIRNRIREYKKDDIISYCLNFLDTNSESIYPIWHILTLIKWTILFGETKYPSKKFTDRDFLKLIREISKFGDNHILNFLSTKDIQKGFQIIYSQQFYLQKNVYKEIFASQLKLFSSIKTKYNIEKVFFELTGLTIADFVYIQQIFWLITNIRELNKPGLRFDGYFDKEFLKVAKQIKGSENIDAYVKLLTLDLNDAIKNIENFKYRIRNYDLQSLEISFFTLFPFIHYFGKVKLVHTKVFSYTVNYYIYDFLKSKDDNFTTDFGLRLEKYVQFGLDEINYKYLKEGEVKNILPINSNLVDFYIRDENIFIECKASELQVHTSINPTDDLIFNSLKTSLFKAYFEQIVPVSNILNPESESWGIIITYKEFFWSQFSRIFDIGKNRYSESLNYSSIPPENVFIIDLKTWDKIISIIKDKGISLLDILTKAKKNNSNPQTSKQLFEMHLDEYDFTNFKLSYLEEELNLLKIQ